MPNTDASRLVVGIDGMSGLFEERATKPELSSRRKRERWANGLLRATDGAVRVDPDELYLRLQELRISSPRVRDGQVIPAGQYYRDVNQRLIRAFAPEQATERAARRLQNALRSDNAHFTIYQDTAEFVDWVTGEFGAPIYVVTAQRDEKVREMLKRHRLVGRKLAGVVTTQAAGFDKLRPEFWDFVLDRVGVPADQFVMIGSNIVTDSMATNRGLPVLVIDRDCFQQRLAETLFPGDEFRGAPLLDIGAEVPPRRAFIGIGRRWNHIKQWLLRIRDARIPIADSQAV